MLTSPIWQVGLERHRPITSCRVTTTPIGMGHHEVEPFHLQRYLQLGRDSEKTLCKHNLKINEAKNFRKPGLVGFTCRCADSFY